MCSFNLAVFLPLLLCVQFINIKGALSSIDVKQNACQKTTALLDCPLYKDSSLVLKWRYRDLSTGAWPKIAIIKRGKTRLFPVNNNLHGRFAVHLNGSLEIRSIHPDDETLYQCIVMQKGDREAHLIELSVACGKTTVTKREVCLEEDVVLDCEAKNRSNPRKVQSITWKKETDMKHGSSSSSIASLVDVIAEAQDGFIIHDNGSLLVQKGREEGYATYKCDVSKTDGSKDETHVVHVKNIKCKNETQTPGCGGVLSNPVGSFQSPNFPSAYPANSHCKWTISLPQNYTAVNVTIDHLNLEPEKKCRYDSLVVYDQLDNQVYCRHCGFYSRAVKFQVIGRTAVVAFQTDGSVQKTGFKVRYQGV